MKFLTFAFFPLGIFLLFPSVSFAEGCPNPTPLDSQIWRDFEKVVQTEYLSHQPFSDESGTIKDLPPMDLQWLAIGHALGRLASAVQNQSDRMIGFNCVQLGIQQLTSYDFNQLEKGTLNSYSRLMQAAMGMHDAEVALHTGVRSTEPLYELFGGKIEAGQSSPGLVLGKEPEGKSTSTITKKDPVTVGGGFTMEDPTKRGAPDGYCSNWMTIAFNDSKGENDADVTEAACTSAKKNGDFITKYNPNSKACSVCFLDDWSGFSDRIVSNGGTAGNTGAVGEGKSHPCMDESIPQSAEWTYYGPRGGGGRAEKEKAGLICKGLGYATYSSSEMKHYACDKGYVNCQLKKTVPIDNVVKKDKKTIYKYGRNSAHRTSLP